MRHLTFRRPVGKKKPDWVKIIRGVLVLSLLIPHLALAQGNEVLNRSKISKSFSPPLILAQSELFSTERPSTVTPLPLPPSGRPGQAQQARPPQQARPSQQAGQAQQATPTQAPSARGSIRSVPKAPTLNIPQFSVTPPEGNTSITRPASPKAVIPQRESIPPFSTKGSAPSRVTPSLKEIPQVNTRNAAPNVATPKGGSIPTFSTRGSAPSRVTPSLKEIPQVNTRNATPNVAIPKGGSIPSFTTKGSAPSRVNPPVETSPTDSTPKTLVPSAKQFLDLPTRVNPTAKDTVKGVESTPGSTITAPVETPQLSTPDAGLDAAQQQAIQEEERIRKAAEEKALFENSRNQRIDSQGRVDSLIQRENVESILGTNNNRDANNNATIANTQRQSQNLENMIRQNPGLVDGAGGSGGDVMMAALDPCLLDLEPYCEAVVDELEDEKKKEDEAWKKELEKRRKKLEKAREQARKEAERRKNNPERKNLAADKRDLSEREEKLVKDKDEIDDEKSRLEEEREQLDIDDQKYRNKDRKLRRGPPADPNCRGANCQANKANQEQLQKDRTRNIKEQTTLDIKNDTYEREHRKWKNETEALEEKLDIPPNKGGVLTPSEHKARMARKTAEKAKSEAALMDQRIKDLKAKRYQAKTNKVGNFTSEEARELRWLEESNFEDKAQEFDDKAKNLEKEVLDKQGFGFNDSAFLTEGDLKQIDSGLGQALANNAEAIENVGKGGDQPHKRGAATLRDEGVRSERENAISQYDNAVDKYDKFYEKLDEINEEIDEVKDKPGRVNSDRYKELLAEKKAMFPDVASQNAEVNPLLVKEINRAVRDYKKVEEGTKLKEFFSGLGVDSEKAFNAVTEYNKSYGDTIDEKGAVNPEAIKQQARQFEKTYGEIQGHEQKLVGARKALNNLVPQSKGQPKTPAKQIGKKLANPQEVKKIQGKLRATNSMLADVEKRLANDKGTEDIEFLKTRRQVLVEQKQSATRELKNASTPFDTGSGREKQIPQKIEPTLAQKMGLSPKEIKKRVGEVNLSIAEINSARSKTIDALSRQGFQGEINEKGVFDLKVADSPFARAYTRGVNKVNEQEKQKSKDRVQVAQAGDLSKNKGPGQIKKETRGLSQGTPPKNLTQRGVREAVTSQNSLSGKRLERGLANINDQIKIAEQQFSVAKDSGIPGLAGAFASQRDALRASRDQIAGAIETRKAAREIIPAQQNAGAEKSPGVQKLERAKVAVNDQIKTVDRQLAKIKGSKNPNLETALTSQRDALRASRDQISGTLETRKAAREITPAQQNAGAETTKVSPKKSQGINPPSLDSVKTQGSLPTAGIKQEEKKEVKVDPFLFDEIYDTGKYQDQVEKKLANIDKLLVKAPKGSMEREQLKKQKARYTGDQIKNTKKLNQLGEQVASLKRQELGRRESGKVQSARLMEADDEQVLKSYVQWVKTSVLPVFDDSPLSQELLPNILSNLVVQFGPRVAEQMVDSALDALDDSGSKPNAALFVDGLLKEVAAEIRKTKGAQAGRIADLARAQFLSSLLTDPQMRDSLKPEEVVLDVAQASLDGLVKRLRAELGKQLDSGVRNVDKTLETLSSLLLLRTFPQSDPSSILPLLELTRTHLDRALGQKEFNDPEGRARSAQDLIASLNEALGKLPAQAVGTGQAKLAKDLAKLLADSYRLRGAAARQLEADARKQYIALKEKIKQQNTAGKDSENDQKKLKKILEKVTEFRYASDKATLGEAVGRLNAGQFARALKLVENVQTQDAQLKLAQANVLVALADRIESGYGSLSADERKAVGDIKSLLASRDQALERLVNNIKDPLKAAFTANRLARNLERNGKIREAILILDGGLDKKPNDPVLSGERVRLQILQQGDKASTESVDKLLKGLPDAVRIPAAILALNRLTQDGNSPKALDALRKSLEGADWIKGAQRRKVDFEIAKAKITEFGGGYRTAEEDRKLEQHLREVRFKLNILGDDEIEPAFRKAVINTLEKTRDDLRQAHWWRGAIKSGIAPSEGFDGIARQALAAGRLDIASEALKKYTARSLFNIRRQHREEGLRGLMNAITILDSVRMRMMDPRLLPHQLKEFQKFITETAPQLVGQINDHIPGRKGRVELRLLGRLRLQAQLAGVSPKERAKKIDEARREAQKNFDDKLKDIKAKFDGLGETIQTDPKKAGAFEKARADLNALRALVDGIKDYEIETSPGYQKDGKPRVAIKEGFLPAQNPREMALRVVQHKLVGITIGSKVGEIWTKRGYEGQKEYRMGLVEKLLNETSREATLSNNTLRNKDKEIFKNFWLEFALLKDEVKYNEIRREELVKEYPGRNFQQRNELYEKLLDHESKTLERILGPSNKAMELVYQVTGTGRELNARVSELEGLILTNRKQALLDDFIASKNAGDAQKVFRTMVLIREASLAGEIDKFVNYLDVDFDDVGPARYYNISVGMEATQEALEAVIADIQRLHPALIRAGYRPPHTLNEADQKLLRKHGYLEGNKYVIPKHIQLTPTTIASDYAAITQEGVAGAVDSVLNLNQIAELIATVAIPGGIAGRFGRALTLELLASGLTRSVGGRLIAHGAGLALEGAVFTGLSRGAQTVFNPEMLLNPELWTSKALIKEYLHNLAVIGALKLYGKGVQALNSPAAKLAERGGALALAGKTGQVAIKTGAFLGEAALLTGLNSALSNNQITQDSFIENLFLIATLKGTGHLTKDLAAETPGDKYAQARIRKQLQEMGKAPGFKPETRVSQTRDSYAKYYKWVNEYSIPIRILQTRFNGKWDAARKAYQNGELSKAKMKSLFDLRKKIVDSLTAEIKKELGVGVDAFGSEDLISDYDVSFTGPKAEIAVVLFNARIMNRWGQAVDIGGSPSGYSLDTNVYTEGRFKLKGGKKDVWFQDGFAHLAARKYLKDGTWKEYRKWLLESVDPMKKANLEKLLDKVEADNRDFKEAIDNKVKEIAEATKDLNPEQRRMVAENQIYEAILKDIKALARKHKWSFGKKRSALAQEIRNLQSKGLYFAQEAYHSEAAIKHVVFSIQAAGREITPKSLLADGPPKLKVAISRAEARQSYTEQIANLLKEINHAGKAEKLSAKAAKYFIRALDAAKIAGLDLKPFKDIVDITYELNENRKDLKKVQKILKDKYGEKNLDQFLKEVREANQKLTAKLFGGPRDFSVATGVGKTGDSAVIALPGVHIERAPTRPIEVAKVPATEPGTNPSGDRPPPRWRTRAPDIIKVRDRLRGLGWGSAEAEFAATIQVVQNNKTVQEALVISAYQRGYSPKKLKSELGVSNAEIRKIVDSYLSQNRKVGSGDTRAQMVDNYLSGKKPDMIANADRSVIFMDTPEGRKKIRIEMEPKNKEATGEMTVDIDPNSPVVDPEATVDLDPSTGRLSTAGEKTVEPGQALDSGRDPAGARARLVAEELVRRGWKEELAHDFAVEQIRNQGRGIMEVLQAAEKYTPRADETMDVPKPPTQLNKEPSTREEFKSAEERDIALDAKNAAKETYDQGVDVISNEPLYERYYFEAKTVEEAHKLGLAGNLRAQMTPLEKALADSAFEIVQRLQDQNPGLKNLLPATSIKYVHLYGNRVNPENGPAGTSLSRLGGRSLSPGEVPASLAAEALLMMGRNVEVSPEQLSRAAGISIESAQAALLHAKTWRDRFGPVKPAAKKPGEKTSARIPPPDHSSGIQPFITPVR